MEENEYRNSYRHLIVRQCIYMRSILACHSDCSQAKRVNLAEREALECQSVTSREYCANVVKYLTEKSRFALHATNPDEPLTYAKQIKIQSGGLLALKRLVEKENVEIKVKDISELLQKIKEAYPVLESLPITELLQDIALFKVRNHKRKS